MKISAEVVSDTGKRRKNNEDNYYLCGAYRSNVEDKYICVKKSWSGGKFLCGVFDGMGGHSGGETASLIAARTLGMYADTDFRKTYKMYFEQTARIFLSQGTDMGTTAAVLYIKNGNAHGYNLGDSRIYLVRDGQIRQLTKDHTRAALMAEMGVIDEQTSQKHMDRHILNRYIGMSDFTCDDVYKFSIRVKSGDIFLLCSDGLYDMLEKDALNDIAAAMSAENLKNAANSAGGADNITAMLVKIDRILI